MKVGRKLAGGVPPVKRVALTRSGQGPPPPPIHLSCTRLVNVAGLGGKEVAALYGGGAFSINPRRGQFVVYDKVRGAPTVLQYT